MTIDQLHSTESDKISKRRPRALVFAAFAAACLIPLSACSGTSADTDSGSSGTAAKGTSMNDKSSGTASGDTMATGKEFGAGCSAVPKDGPGSFGGMATAPVATAASANPALTTLVAAVKAAGLVDSLNSAAKLTVFAPADSAFAAVPKATMDTLLADPSGDLTKILTYHVLPERLAPDKLAGDHKTLNGASLKVEGSGSKFTVNGEAMVVCGNVQTANATVYIIDKVLMPPA